MLAGEQYEGHRTPPYLIRKLHEATRDIQATLGVPTTWPLERRATYSLRLLGDGGKVNLDSPWTVRRAITILENAQ